MTTALIGYFDRQYPGIAIADVALLVTMLNLAAGADRLEISQQQLAEAFCRSESRTRQLTERLAGLGYFGIEHQHRGNGWHRANVYIFAESVLAAWRAWLKSLSSTHPPGYGRRAPCEQDRPKVSDSCDSLSNSESEKTAQARFLKKSRGNLDRCAARPAAAPPHRAEPREVTDRHRYRPRQPVAGPRRDPERATENRRYMLGWGKEKLQALYPRDWERQFVVDEVIARCRALLDENPAGWCRMPAKDKAIIDDLHERQRQWKELGYPPDGYARQHRADQPQRHEPLPVLECDTWRMPARLASAALGRVRVND
jgi:hypothetical protein